MAVKLPSDLLHQGNIHLVIQEAVDLQNITGLYDSVLCDSLFQKIHGQHLHNLKSIIAHPCQVVSCFLEKSRKFCIFGNLHTAAGMLYC